MSANKEIFKFSTPIVLSMLMLNFMGLVDGALVGHLGTEALAAYGLAFFIHFVHAGVLMGLASAVQAITANMVGAGKKDQAAMPLNSAIIASIVFGAIVTIAADQYKDVLLSFMTKNQEVQKLASDYLHMRFYGIFAIGITHSFRGFWNGIGRPGTYLVLMGLSYLLNALLSYAFIFGKWGLPPSGLNMIALSSTLATVFAAVLNYVWATMTAKGYGLNSNYFEPAIWKNLIKQSVPSGLTQLLFALGYAVFFAIIGKLGANELAAANVLVTISLFFIYPGMGMGMTAANYVARAQGAHEWDKAFFWTKKVAIYSIALFGVISIPFLIFSQEFLSVFIKSEIVYEMARVPYLVFISTLVIEILGQIYTFAFLGAARPKVILVVSTAIQWLGIIPLSYFFGSDLLKIWLIQIALRSLQTLILFVCWRKSRPT